MFIRDAELLFGANHRERLNPADNSPFEFGEHLPGLVSIVEHGTFAGISYFESLSERSLPFIGVEVRRAGEDNQLLDAIVEPAENQAVCIGVRQHFQYLSHHKFFTVPREAFIIKFMPLSFRLWQTYQPNAFHLQSNHGEVVSDLLNVQVI